MSAWNISATRSPWHCQRSTAWSFVKSTPHIHKARWERNGRFLSSRGHQEPASADSVPFVPNEPLLAGSNNSASSALLRSQQRSSTLTDRERDAFVRLFEITTGPSGLETSRIKSVTDVTRRTPRERDDEVLSILESAVFRTRTGYGTTGDEETLRKAFLLQPNRTISQISRSVKTEDNGSDMSVQYPSSRNSRREFAIGGSDVHHEKLHDVDVELAGPGNKRAAADEETENQIELGSSHGGNIPSGSDPTATLRHERHAQIATKLKGAQTDCLLWQVLDDEVFSIIRKLDLDGPHACSETSAAPSLRANNAHSKTARKGRKKKSAHVLVADEKLPKDTISDQAAMLSACKTPKSNNSTNQFLTQEAKMLQLAVIGPIYPSLLVQAVRQLRGRFPGSTLPFAILPTIKDLGRSSYVLGASTPLYNELILAAYATYCDFQTIDGLLAEMENAGLEFNNQTFEILTQIRREGNHAKKTQQELAVQKMFWNTDIHRDGWRRVIAWIAVLKRRLQDKAAREAEEMRELQDLRPCQYEPSTS